MTDSKTRPKPKRRWHQFNIKTLLLVTSTVCLLLWWWLPGGTTVHRAPIQFPRWQPSVANERFTTKEKLCNRLGYVYIDDDPFGVDWPDFTKCDVVPIPLNGLAGEATAEFRMKELGTPASFQFDNTPLIDVAEAIEEQFGITCELSTKVLYRAGIDAETPIDFQAEKEPLRDALTKMLAPLQLTYVIVWGAVYITTEAEAESVLGPSYIASSWDPSIPQLNTRRRLGGGLVFVTSFANRTEIDSRAIGFAVPKRAAVVYATDTTANIFDAGLTALLVGGVAIVIVFSRRKLK